MLQVPIKESRQGALGKPMDTRQPFEIAERYLAESDTELNQPSGPTACRSQLGFKGDGLGYRVIRRALELIIAVAALVVFAPLMTAIAVVIKLDSSGPVLFKHVRIGLNRRKASQPYEGPDRRRENRFGKPFTLYKFRSMYANARLLYPELYTYRYSSEELEQLPIKVLVGRKSNGAQLRPDGRALLDDPRLTRVGKWLRRTSLDELPNFLNVLKGDMHLIGPRPDITENIRYYSAQHLKKLDVKPGITGLAQINGRGNLSFLETNDFDVEYVKNRSLVLDIKIFIKTITATFRAEGAY
ncbi:sugar transferase [Candidatus Nitrospira bockiana]